MEMFLTTEGCAATIDSVWCMLREYGLIPQHFIFILTGIGRGECVLRLMAFICACIYCLMAECFYNLTTCVPLRAPLC